MVYDNYTKESLKNSVSKLFKPLCNHDTCSNGIKNLG